MFVTLWLSLRCLWEREGILVVARMALSWLLGLGLAMPALLMFIEYYLHTARSVEAGGISAIWSVPPEAFWGLINPLFVSLWNIWGVVRRHYSFELFCSVVPPVVMLVLAFSPSLRKKTRLGFELLFLAFVVALMVLPSGTASYRWSFRWMPLYSLLMAIIAARTFDYLETKRQDPYVITIFGGQVSAIMLCAFGSAAIFAYQYLIMGYGGVTEDRGLYAIGIMAGFFLWAYVSRRRKKYNKIIKSVPVVVTIASFGFINILPLNPSILAKWRVLDDLHNEKLHFSDNIRYMNLFTRDDFFSHASADTILPGNTPMLVKVHCVTGYSPMMLNTFFQLFGFEYSSSMKPAVLDATCKHAFATGGMFDLLGIDGVVLGFSQRERAGQAVKEGWNVVNEGPGGVILHRARRNDMHIESVLLATYEKSDADVVRALREKSDGARRHVLLDADGGQPSRDAAFSPVSIDHLVAKRNSLAADIANASQETPGLIVFKRAWYPGYRVFLDDRELPLVHADMLLPAVVIPPGQSGRLLLDYAPRSLRIGLIAAGCSLFLLLGLVAYGMKGRVSRAA
ncbi:MAG TPA: hypothetical protein PKD41_03135 [Solidesulfovibrio sp.]|nr:hypothetical protein [Solidesulfovibrio sp.]